MNCKICFSPVNSAFKSKILQKYDVEYFCCNKCGYLFTEEPYWLNEAYKSPINISDTGLVNRNITLSEKLSVLLFFFFPLKEKYLDYAGGYGLFTRLMRDIGFDFYWYDLYCDNIFARGFEYEPTANIKPCLVTAFEVFEHLPNPYEEMQKLIMMSDTIVFSTDVKNELVPPKDWWYYGFQHGQHISFYSTQTLKTLAEKFDLKYYSLGGSLHMFTRNNFNRNILKFIVKFARVGLISLVRRQMKSKTWDDHILMEKE